MIGTGLFLGSADALYHGGPIGALIGYSIIGTVVYCLCVSIGEMIAFLLSISHSNSFEGADDHLARMLAGLSA